MQRSMILDPTAIFLMSLAKTSEIKIKDTVGNFGWYLIFFDDAGCVKSLFFFSVHFDIFDSTKKNITVLL